jgi:hypothetical protein
VWSTALPANIQDAGKTIGNPLFNPSKSSTFKSLPGSTWKIQYGDLSSASGTVGTDNLTIGDIVVENQAIEVANKLSTQFAQSVGR